MGTVPVRHTCVLGHPLGTSCLRDADVLTEVQEGAEQEQHNKQIENLLSGALRRISPADLPCRAEILPDFCAFSADLHHYECNQPAGHSKEIMNLP